MRSIAIALVLGMLGLAPATASAAHAAKGKTTHARKAKTAHARHHARRAVKHAKAKVKRSRAQHAANDGVMPPFWS